MTTLRSMLTPHGERILVTLSLCTTVSACDTFADAPHRTNTSDAPLPAVRPLPPGTVSAVSQFTSPPPTAPTSVSTLPPVSPQPTVTTPPLATTPPASLPTCPQPTHVDDTSGQDPSNADPSSADPSSADRSRTSPSGTDPSGTPNGAPSNAGDETSGAFSGAGSDTPTEGAASSDASARHDAGAPVNGGDAAPTPLPSGDTVVVDDLTLLIIFDNSGSMAECWDGKTRWEHANHALRAAIEPAQHSLKVGAIRFPADTECLVEPFRSENQFAFGVGHEFLAAWDAHTRYPIGGTPLAAAMIEADKAIQDAAAAGLLAQRFRVVILTDGEPNCDGSTSLLTTLPTAWRAQGVETRVLGLPGSDSAATLLQNIADAGGGVYEQLTTPGELHDSAQRAAR